MLTLLFEFTNVYAFILMSCKVFATRNKIINFRNVAKILTHVQSQLLAAFISDSVAFARIRSAIVVAATLYLRTFHLQCQLCTTISNYNTIAATISALYSCRVYSHIARHMYYMLIQTDLHTDINVCVCVDGRSRGAAAVLLRRLAMNEMAKDMIMQQIAFATTRMAAELRLAVATITKRSRYDNADCRLPTADGRSDQAVAAMR